MYNIDDIYNGFSDTLLLYENRLLDINKRFQDKVESNLTVQYSSFCKEVLDLKKELDLSEFMHNFLKHRFQIALDQSIGNSSENLIGNEVCYNKILIESKKEIVDKCEQEYNAKLEKEKEIIDRQYSSELDKLTNQVKELEKIIEKKNKEIKTKSSKIKTRENKNERIKNECRSKLDGLTNKIKEYETIIENQK